LLKNKMTTNPFKPAFGLSNRHIQTSFSTLFRRQKAPKTKIEKFELKDGDFVECFWNNRENLRDNKPIVVLFHGLTGSFKSPYIQGMINRLQKADATSVLMHFRGCSGKPNRLPRSYHSGDTADAKEWLEYLANKYPTNQIYTVGYSLGGNMLLKLLGELGDRSLIKKAISISAPMELEISAKSISKGLSKIYQYRIIKELKATLLEKYAQHDMKSLLGIDKEDVKKFRTFFEFDEAYTAPIHGFSSAKEYYRLSSSKQYLRDITTDTLILHALDDPFMSAKVLPRADEVSQSTTLEIYPCGGHVGFISGNLFRQKYWLEDRVVEYFKI
jgi:hypothetical protein